MLLLFRMDTPTFTVHCVDDDDDDAIRVESLNNFTIDTILGGPLPIFASLSLCILWSTPSTWSRDHPSKYSTATSCVPSAAVLSPKNSSALFFSNARYSSSSNRKLPQMSSSVGRQNRNDIYVEFNGKTPLRRTIYADLLLCKEKEARSNEKGPKSPMFSR